MHWDEERDKFRVETMRKCGKLALEFKQLIDEYEKTGDDIYWNAFAQTIRAGAKKQAQAL